MCGIAGFVCPGTLLPGQPRAELVTMLRRIAHRGPDAEGSWSSSDGRVHLGHRRLAILDLTPSGAQPMQSACGRFTIVFNGEVYNFVELKREITASCGIPWRGSSDTEVVLEAINLWGVEGALRRFNGMFAFALHDARMNKLVLARDRFGEKPLYFGPWNGRLVFASELKALFGLPGFTARLDEEAVRELLEFGYIGAPRTVFEGCSKLEPGSYAIVTLGAHDWRIAVGQYWKVLDEILATDRSAAPENELLEEFSSTFERAVAMRMVADVPIGAFLSGGIDSSAVVCAMVRSGQRARTYSIGFEEADYDESANAESVARHLGTEHTTFRVSLHEALQVVPHIPEMFDEPFADSSQIPTHLVSRLARDEVKVVLTGDGGDEIFLGYNRHVAMPALWKALHPWPTAARSSAASILACSATRLAAKQLQRLLPAARRTRLIGEKMQKAAQTLRARSEEDAYWSTRAMAPSAGNASGHRDSFVEAWARLASAELPLAERIAAIDTLDYLPGDVLTKVDRASMAVGLETRVPFLDIELFRFAWSLPLSQRIAGGTGKRIVRRYLSRHLPSELFERSKMGFGLPIQIWLRGPLRDWAEDLLSAERLSRLPGVDTDEVRKAWRAHREGVADRHHYLWNVLTLQAWIDRYRPVLS